MIYVVCFWYFDYLLEFNLKRNFSITTAERTQNNIIASIKDLPMAQTSISTDLVCIFSDLFSILHFETTTVFGKKKKPNTQWSK